MAKTSSVGIEFVKIRYCGATLIAPAFIEPLWPYDLLPSEWPTFCGAGEGLGDAIVSDSIRGVRISPACFLHDIEWAVTPNTFGAFMGANGRLFLNSSSLIMASDLATWDKIRALNRAMTAYLTAVSTVGILFFSWFNGKTETEPLQNAVVLSRLKRIDKVRIKLQKETDIEYTDYDGIEMQWGDKV